VSTSSGWRTWLRRFRRSRGTDGAKAAGRNGEYSFHGLLAGDYDIQLKSFGRFEVPLRDALWSVSVYGGTNVLADFDLFEKGEEWDRGR